MLLFAVVSWSSSSLSRGIQVGQSQTNRLLPLISTGQVAKAIAKKKGMYSHVQLHHLERAKQVVVSTRFLEVCLFDKELVTGARGVASRANGLESGNLIDSEDKI